MVIEYKHYDTYIRWFETTILTIVSIYPSPFYSTIFCIIFTDLIFQLLREPRKLQENRIRVTVVYCVLIYIPLPLIMNYASSPMTHDDVNYDDQYAKILNFHISYLNSKLLKNHNGSAENVVWGNLWLMLHRIWWKCERDYR